MKKQFLCVLISFLINLPVMVDYDACIEPRNSVSQDTISDMQWSKDDSTLYVATMGTIWKLSLNDSSVEILHRVCGGRFPIIEVSESYYAIGSDFLPRLFIYDIATEQLAYELDLRSENVRSAAFSESGDYIALSTSSWDETGFFDIERNIEVWNYHTGERLAEIIPDRDDTTSVYLPFGSRVSFLAEDSILVYGTELDDAWNPPQPIVYGWNWQTNLVEHVNIEADSMIEVIGSEIAVIVPYANANIVVSLLPTVRTRLPQIYEISLGDIFETRLDSNIDLHLLAIENQKGLLWVIDLERRQITHFRELERFATVLAFDHAGNRIALGYWDGTIQLWDLSSDNILTINNVLEE